jgi:AraC-like DNA-binding protein
MESSRQCYMILPKDNQLGFFVRSCGHFILVPPDREARRKADFAEIFWGLRGRGAFRDGNDEYILKENQVWYYPPGYIHDFFPKSSAFQYYWLAIEGRSAGRLFEDLGIRPGLSQAGPCPEGLFSSVMLDAQSPERTKHIRALATAIAILTQIVTRGVEKLPQESPSSVDKAIIDENFGDPELNVESIAKLLHMHRVSLSRIFARDHRMSISNYLISCRIRHAMSLLHETDLRLKEIAQASGFKTSEYFSRAFLQAVGMPPGVFRKRGFV